MYMCMCVYMCAFMCACVFYEFGLELASPKCRIRILIPASGAETFITVLSLHTYMYKHIYYKYMCVQYTCMYNCTCMCAFMCAYVCVCARTYVSTCVCECVCVTIMTLLRCPNYRLYANIPPLHNYYN